MKRRETHSIWDFAENVRKWIVHEADTEELQAFIAEWSEVTNDDVEINWETEEFVIDQTKVRAPASEQKTAPTAASEDQPATTPSQGEVQA